MNSTTVLAGVEDITVVTRLTGDRRFVKAVVCRVLPKTVAEIAGR
jgi:hypothetical protein